MKLQNNFTTPEQSKRLLELGLPADSADCYCLTTVIGQIQIVLPESARSGKDFKQFFPCWSVGRLIEIGLLCREQKDGMFAKLSFCQTGKQLIDGIGTGDIVEGLVRYLESKDYKYDFSKLED